MEKVTNGTRKSSRLLSYFTLLMIVILPIIKMDYINYYSGISQIIIYIGYYLIIGLFSWHIYKEFEFSFVINFLLVDIAVLLPLIKLNNGFDTITTPKAEYLYTIVTIICIFCVLKKLNVLNSNKVKEDICRGIIVDVYILIYFILIVFSTILSISLKRSLTGRIFWCEGFFALSCYLFLFLAASKYYKFSKLHIYLLTTAASIISIIGILQFYGMDLLGIGPKFEVYATIGQHDMIGSYTVLVLPIVIFAYLYCKKSYKYFYLIAVSLIYLCMLCSFARSAWVGFGVMLILSLYLLFKHERKILKSYFVVLLLLFAITIMFNMSSNSRMLSRANSIGNDFNSVVTKTDNYKGAGSQRIYIWEKAVGLILDRPILGSGPDTFDLEVKRVYGYFIYDGGIDRVANGALITKAHNEYLQIAVTLGIPALICYLIFLISIFKHTFLGIKSNKLLIPLICSITAYLIQAFFNNSVIGVAPVFWILLGITKSGLYITDNSNYFQIR